MGTGVVATRTGEFALIEAAIPPQGNEIIGVLLLDRESGQLHHRLRRDWSEFLDDEEDVEYFDALEDDLSRWAAEQGGAAVVEHLEDKLSNRVLVTDLDRVLVHDWDATLAQLYRRHVPSKVLPFRTHVPVYSVRAAAGKFGEAMEVEPEDWVEVREKQNLTEEMFAAHVTGRSMEPKIPDGSLCLFRHGVVGSRTGRLVLVENYGEPGENRYTIKRYRRAGEKVRLEPLNPEYEAWEIDPEDPRVRVIAEFLAVL